MKPGFRAKLAVTLALLVAGLSLVQSTEYGREEAGGDLGNCVPNCDDVRVLARDRNLDDGVFVLRSDPGTFANMRLEFGRVIPGTERAYRAAFAFSNEEPFPVALDSVTLSGPAADWVTLPLHNSSNRFAAQDTGPTLVIWDGPGADAPGVQSAFTWTLDAGDMDMGTAGDLAEYAVSGPDPLSNSRYISTLGPVVSSRSAGTAKDFVWVEMRVRVPPGTPTGPGSGNVTVTFGGLPAGAAQYGRFQQDHSVNVTRGWYLGPGFSCAGDTDIVGSAFSTRDGLLYFAGATAAGGTDLEPALTAAGWPGGDFVSALALDSTGDVYVTGENREFVRFDAGSGTATDLEPALVAAGWAGGTEIRTVAVDALDRAYVAGDTRNFMRYDPGTGLATDLEPALALAGWPAAEAIRAVAVHPVSGLVYVAGDNRDFMVYDPGLGAATDLEPALATAGWTAAEEIFAIDIDPTTGLVYLGGLTREAAVFDPGLGTAADLEPALTAAGWAGGDDIYSISIDAATGDVYFAGENREFAVYVPGPGTATDLEPALTAAGWPGGTEIRAIAFDASAGAVHVGGDDPQFMLYDPATGTATDQVADIIAAGWAGGDAVFAIAADPGSGLVYAGGDNREFVSTPAFLGTVFCSYDPADPNAGVSIPGLTVAAPNAVLFNPVDGRIYIGGDNRDLVAYDPLTGVFTDLEPALVGAGWPAGDNVQALTVNAAGDVFVAGENREFARYDLLAGTFTDLEPSLTAAGWPGGDEIFAAQVDAAGNVYVGGTDRDFMRWNVATGTATNLEASLTAAGWPGADDILALARDAGGIIYVAGFNRDFMSFAPGPGTATNREPLLAGFWAAGTEARALAYDATDNAVYISGDNGEFARFNVAAAAAMDVQPAITGFWGTAGTAPVLTLSFDPLNSDVYLAGGQGRLAVYDPALGAGPPAADDLRRRRLLPAPPTALVPSFVTDAIAAATQQIDDAANPQDTWVQVPKFAVATPLAGTWTFDFHGCRSAGLAAGSIQARIFRNSDDALLATTTGPALGGLPVCGGSGQLTWSPALGALPALAAGDGFYVQFWVAGATVGQSITLQYDSAGTPTGVVTP